MWHKCLFFVLAYLVLLQSVCKVWSFSSLVRNDKGQINVLVKRTFDVPPNEAQTAWLSYFWEQGADLPFVLVIPRHEKSRLLFPSGLEEKIIDCYNETVIDSVVCNTGVSYVVSHLGPILGQDLVEGSHLGNVSFRTNDRDVSKTDMTWNVTLQAKKRMKFYQFLTNFLIEMSSDNLLGYTASPHLYTRKTFLPLSTRTNIIEVWKSFIWKRGGGLPCYPPILNFLDNTGNTRIYFPPGLIEQVVSMKTNMKDSFPESEILYRVVNPSYLTYPVYTHKGRVQFIPNVEANRLEMVWEVEIRPKLEFSKLFTSAVISTLSRNFKVHTQEMHEKIDLISQEERTTNAFISNFVSKDTWLGGVLDEQKLDRRTKIEKLLSIFQPWTWGRSSDNYDVDGEGEEWSRGFISDQ